MIDKEEIRLVLEAEIKRWSALPLEQVIAEVTAFKTYEVKVSSGACQVEVGLLENTDDYLHIVVSVDNGRLPTSILPVSDSFIRRKA